MRTRKLGRTPLEVSVIGYGAMALSLDGVDEEKAVRTLHRILDRGVGLIDTADSYCIDESDQHHNERLVAKALATYKGDTSGVVVATKGGTVRRGGKWLINGSPDRLYRTIRESHEALGGRRPIPVWQHHWPDPRYPVRDSLRAVRRAQEEGLILHVGLSNYSRDQIRQAREVLDVVSVQNQYSFWCRDPEQDGVLEYCEKEGLALFPWRPFGGKGLAQRLPDVRPLATLAAAKGVSVYRLVIAWMLARSPCMIPIPGTTILDEMFDCLAASELELTPAEVSTLSRVTGRDLPEFRNDPRPRLSTTDFGS